MFAGGRTSPRRFAPDLIGDRRVVWVNEYDTSGAEKMHGATAAQGDL
jgi:hypothetical protein